MRLALLLPLWLTLTVGEHSVVHACPTHAPPAAASTDSHAHHGTPPQDDASHGDHACACIDSCATTAIATLDAPPTLGDVDIAFFELPAFAPDAAAGSAASQLRLPFPNGPPTIAG